MWVVSGAREKTAYPHTIVSTGQQCEIFLILPQSMVHAGILIGGNTKLPSTWPIPLTLALDGFLLNLSCVFYLLLGWLTSLQLLLQEDFTDQQASSWQVHCPSTLQTFSFPLRNFTEIDCRVRERMKMRILDWNIKSTTRISNLGPFLERHTHLSICLFVAAHWKHEMCLHSWFKPEILGKHWDYWGLSYATTEKTKQVSLV